MYVDATTQTLAETRPPVATAFRNGATTGRILALIMMVEFLFCEESGPQIDR